PHLEEVPPEVIELFKDGMSIEEFILLNNGQIPRALEPFVDREVAVIIELEAPPLAAKLTEKGGIGVMSAMDQRKYVETLRETQAQLEPQLQALGARVFSRYQKVYNGFLARVPLRQLAAIRDLPGVKAVHRAPEHRPSLAASVPLIGADQVWTQLGYEGEGVTIAIVDTGIDYYHAALGGSGDPADYANDDREIIEPGTFPTAKVIGGYDFAGPNYDASSDDPDEYTPQPDPDPLDGDGHGTHVASTAAGVATDSVSKGVAPKALLYALKVFGEPAGSTNLVLDAVEWSMDPNGDGDVSDRVDVINMSLGATYGPNDPTDPEIIAINNASALGVIVVASAGNSGNVSYIHGSPAAADSAIAVAASTTGYATAPTLSISGTLYVTQTNIIYQPPAFDGGTGLFTERMTATLAYVGVITTSDFLCSTDGIPEDALAGKIALIQRGVCSFSVKVNNAAALGAVGAIIFNSAAGGNERITMGGDPVAIPAGFIARQDGLYLIPAHGQTVIVSAVDEVRTLPDPYTPADTIATFSSRGPRGFDSSLKPDVSAPGVGIFAAAVGTGDGGVSYSGTSMAAPHVAGLAALIREAHPDWTPEQVKAAMMNTAVDLVAGPSRQTPRQGAGRIQAYPAVTAETIAIGDPDRVSLNWGVLPIEADTYTALKNVTLQNFFTATKVYSATWTFGAGSRTLGVSLSLPVTVEVPAMGTAAVPVTLNINATQLSSIMRTLEEYYGYVVFTNAAVPTETLRVPFYLSPRPYTRLTTLGSSTTFDYETGFAWFDLYHSGPISSSLWVYPVFAVDGNETDVADAGDVRLVGVDYGGYTTYGNIFVVAINAWGSWHTPQPSFAEFDLYLDVDEDGEADLVNFNWNYGRFTGTSDNDQWVVVQVDLSTGELSLTSPFPIYTDYNAGFMEWYLPATWNGLEDIAPGANTDFDFQLLGFDYWGAQDVTEAGRFDFARPPFEWDWLPGYPGHPGPFGRETPYVVVVDDLGGYLYSRPKGVMIVDYNGKPGKGQAYYWPLRVTGYPQIFLPLVTRNFGP
ncbi:MAG: S8 family serine peptidase, partial [Anaerolineae bacterium]